VLHAYIPCGHKEGKNLCSGEIQENNFYRHILENTHPGIVTHVRKHLLEAKRHYNDSTYIPK